MTTVAVLGATGFVGSRVVAALESRGAKIRAVHAPRLSTQARSLPSLLADLDRPWALTSITELREQFADIDVIVNSAGMAIPTGRGGELFGANALLPGLIARAAVQQTRVLHISSAAVQGRRPVLDESEEYDLFSPYSASKGLGEQVLLTERTDACCYRPTSVHGTGRSITVRLAKLLSGPACSVAGTGLQPTPQVLVDNVADAVAFLALTETALPRVVLHPWEGMTTAALARALGDREPHHVPEPLARSLVRMARVLGARSSRIAGQARRLEMLWFGQPQKRSWLEGQWEQSISLDVWRELG